MGSANKPRQAFSLNLQPDLPDTLEPNTSRLLASGAIAEVWADGLSDSSVVYHVTVPRVDGADMILDCIDYESAVVLARCIERTTI